MSSLLGMQGNRNTVFQNAKAGTWERLHLARRKQGGTRCARRGHAAAWALSLQVALAYTATTLPALAAPFPALLAVSSGHRGRPPCRLRLSQWAASVALLHNWDAGQVVACSVVVL